jgi:nucleoside-diphosphate-sugar epimerase
MANYLVTGVAGFIAARVTEMMLENGHNVLGWDNLNDAYDVRLKEYRLKRLQSQRSDSGGKFSFHRLDISDRSVLEHESIKGWKFDAVINLAARAGVRVSVIDPWVYVDTNVTGTLNMLELCHRQGIPKFILASTSSVYGENAPLPTPEDYDSSYPLQPYAASKKGAEALCHAYHYLYGIDATVVRYFTVYGPAGRPDMVLFRFVKWISEGLPVHINGDGNQSRGFTYVDDIASGTILALKTLGNGAKPSFEIINLGGHETITINNLMHMVEQDVGHKARVAYGPLHPADVLANWANVEKAKQLLGWEPKVSLSEGVSRLVDWYQAERTWVSQVNTD